MLDLGDAELELVPFVARHETELPKRAVECRAGALADTNGVTAPPRRGFVDESAHLRLAHTTALGERIRELVRTFRGQRHGADEREHEPFNGLVHAGAHACAGAGVRVSLPRRQPLARPSSARERRAAAPAL